MNAVMIDAKRADMVGNGVPLCRSLHLVRCEDESLDALVIIDAFCKERSDDAAVALFEKGGTVRIVGKLLPNEDNLKRVNVPHSALIEAHTLHLIP